MANSIKHHAYWVVLNSAVSPLPHRSQINNTKTKTARVESERHRERERGSSGQMAPDRARKIAGCTSIQYLYIINYEFLKDEGWFERGAPPLT